MNFEKILRIPCLNTFPVTQLFFSFIKCLYDIWRKYGIHFLF